MDATRTATALLGDSIATNLFMTGFAWQQGLIPISRQAIEQAIELNGVAIEANKRAFDWGRRAAADPAAVERAVAPVAEPEKPRLAQTLEQIVAYRKAFLTGSQNRSEETRGGKESGRT